MSDFVLRPKKAVIQISLPDGRQRLACSAMHLAEILAEELGVHLSKYQTNRLCNGYPYKRPTFDIPQGVTIARLNSTVALRRNLHAD